MGGKSGKTEVTLYHMSIHMGFCTSDVNLEMLAVWVGEKEAWRGNAKEGQDVTIARPDLFGGAKKEGGVSGLISWLPGDLKQTLSEFLATKLGVTTRTAPGFRGIASLFFTDSLNSTTGFYWTANNPYLKDVWARFRRPPVGLNPSIAMIQLDNDANGNTQYGANPAHMIFECQTNTDWGEGSEYGAFDISSYETAAQTLYDEGFALAAKWMRPATIEDFTGEVLDHINGIQYDSIRTGKRTLKLLRDDYVISELREINQDNATMSKFQRKAWGEISNEVVATWTNPETESEQSVTAQDLGGIAAQGGIVSTGRNFYMVRSEALALRLAERDLAMAVQPVAVCDVEVSRTLWDVEPGDVFKLTWPDYGISQVIVRVLQVTNGADKESLSLKLTEDVFGLASASYLQTSSTLWADPASEPASLTNVYLGTCPAFLAAKAFGKNDPGELSYPDAAALVVAAPNTTDYTGFELTAPGPLVNGIIQPTALGEKAYIGRMTLVGAVVPETQTIIPTMTNIHGVSAAVGDIVLFQGASDTDTEIAVVRSVSAGGAVTIDRGALDTTPKAWAIGTPLWFTGITIGPYDFTVRADTETVAYRLLPTTSLGTLPYDSAAINSVTLSDRALLPLRPADVKVEGDGYGPVALGGGTSIVVTWANRNRVVEAEQILTWDAANVVGEVGQTTVVRVLNPDNSVEHEVVGLTGVTTTIAKVDLGLSASVRIQVLSVLDGDESLQAHEIQVTLV